jgi:hypothetical protein
MVTRWFDAVLTIEQKPHRPHVVRDQLAVVSLSLDHTFCVIAQLKAAAIWLMAYLSLCAVIRLCI